MDLLGALSNSANRDKLARLAASRRRLLRGAPAQVAPTPRPPARAGEVVQAVEEVLASKGVMRVGEVVLAVENSLQRVVNRKTVKACLSEGALATPPRFKRTGHGRYRLI
jgi:hypothetical protein